MIDQLTLTDFKGHRASTIALQPLTVFVGPNGAGKTSALEALHLLGQLQQKNFDKVFSGPFAPEHLARHDNGVEEFRLATRGTSISGVRSFELSVTMDEHGMYDPASGGALLDDEGEEYVDQDWRAFFYLGQGDEAKTKEVFYNGRSLREEGLGDHWPELRGAVLFRLDASRIAAPSVASTRTRVRSDGGGTATVIANLKLTDTDRMGRVQAALQRIVPQIQQIRVRPAMARAVTGEQAPGYELVFDLHGGPDVPATGASEGTLLSLALLTALSGPSRPQLLLLDDIHEALHPRAQSRLMQVLRDLTTGPDPIQVIATTHSPYILDAVDPSAVQVFALREDGTSAVRPLSEHPDAAAYAGSLSTGQLWTLDDEASWVTAGVP